MNVIFVNFPEFVKKNLKQYVIPKNKTHFTMNFKVFE